MAQRQNNKCRSIERRRPVGTALLDLYDYAEAPAAIERRCSRHDSQPIAVRDNWPEIVAITQAEIRAIEAHFGDVLDDLFGPLP